MSEYRLSELNTFIRRFVALNLPDAVWVQAELAEVDERRGHYYLNLIEQSEDSDQALAQARAIMWERQAKRWQRQHRLMLDRIFQSGRELKLQVRVEFHERYGLSMQVLDLDPHYTLGILAQKRQATLDMLQSMNLLAANKQQSLALAPQRLAVISSPAAAGLQDFLSQLKENIYGYDFRVQLFPAAVQGPQTSPEVRRQLRTIQRRVEDYDAIVIIRGGGAKMDLADFDERELCTAAAQCSLPIITGIGHETDQSIMDMLAHTALKTPTAAAHFFVDRLLQLDQHLAGLAQQTSWSEQQHLRQAENQLRQLKNTLQLREQQLIQGQQWQINSYQEQLPILARNRLTQEQRKLADLANLHQVLSMEGHFQRGFSLLTQDGQIIKQIADLNADLPATIQLRDGSAQFEVKSTAKKK